MTADEDAPADEQDNLVRRPTPLTRRMDFWAIVISVLSLIVAIFGSLAAYLEANVARSAYEDGQSEQARRVNVEVDDFASLTVENASSAPLKRVAVYLAGTLVSDDDPLAALYASQNGVPACTSVTWESEDIYSGDLAVVFTDVNDQDWLISPGGSAEEIDIDPYKYPDSIQGWESTSRTISTCS